VLPHRALICAFALAFALLWIAPSNGQTTELVPNPSFEEGIQTPQGWQVWGKGSMAWDDTTAY
jgi:hypothetical protein